MTRLWLAFESEHKASQKQENDPKGDENVDIQGYKLILEYDQDQIKRQNENKDESNQPVADCARGSIWYEVPVSIEKKCEKLFDGWAARRGWLFILGQNEITIIVEWWGWETYRSQIFVDTRIGREHRIVPR